MELAEKILIENQKTIEDLRAATQGDVSTEK